MPGHAPRVHADKEGGDDQPYQVQDTSIRPLTMALPTSHRNTDSATLQARRQRRRLQCRRNQRRYRDKQVSQEYNLQLDVNKLRGQVAQLEIHKSLLQHRRLLAIQNDSLVSKILKYYELFRFGLVEPSSSPASSVSSSSSSSSSSLSSSSVWEAYERQVAYFYCLMADHMQRGDELVSAPVVLELWKRVTLFQSEYEMQVLACELINADHSPIVHVQAVMKYRITRTTITNLFPHVQSNESLVQSLVGKKLECLMSCDYVFNEHHQVVQHSIQVDTLMALQKLLKKLDVTLEVMQHALITDNYFVGKWSGDKEAEVLLVQAAQPHRSHHHTRQAPTEHNAELDDATTSRPGSAESQPKATGESRDDRTERSATNLLSVGFLLS